MTFYNYNKIYRNRLSRVKQEFPESYPLIEEFAFDLIAQGISISRFCSRCGLPLNEDALKEARSGRRERAKHYPQLTKPDLIKIFMSMQRELEMLKMEIEKLRNGDGGK